jgi:hypothetical protein
MRENPDWSKAANNIVSLSRESKLNEPVDSKRPEGFSNASNNIVSFSNLPSNLNNLNSLKNQILEQIITLSAKFHNNEDFNNIIDLFNELVFDENKNFTKEEAQNIQNLFNGIKIHLEILEKQSNSSMGRIDGMHPDDLEFADFDQGEIKLSFEVANGIFSSILDDLGLF